MRFKGLDLNLLVVFDALMNTRSVSRTAEHLNLSQPAISSALRRLREYFRDEILVSHGKRMFPTPYAESLLPQVKDSLRVVEGLIATSAGFDPAESSRTFRICSSDYFVVAVLAPLARRLAAEAPNVRLEFMLNDERAWQQLEQGGADMIIVPEDYRDQEFPAEMLYDEYYVVAGWAENPLLQPGAMDEAAFMAAGHIQVSIGYVRTATFADRAMEAKGMRRRIEATSSSFGLLPYLLVGTQRLALMHKRHADVVCAELPIAMAPVPFEFPVMRMVIQYHAVRAADPGINWLRDQIKAEAAQGN